MTVYADNAATTRMSRTALDAMLPAMEENYGNPSSLHSVGQRAAELLMKSRETVARCLNCQPREIIFTSGGSEADNQAILSAARLGERKGKKHIISTAFEHHAVLHTLKKLEKEGFEVELLPVGPIGTVTAQQVKDACAHLDENAKKVSALRDRLIDGLSKIPHSALNGDPVNRLPGNVSFCFEGVEGESLLLLLDAKGICASSGSACTSGSLDPSHVLLAIGRPHDVAHGSLRLSLCEWNTDEEIDRILDAVPEVVEYLRGMSPLWKDLVSGKKPFTL